MKNISLSRCLLIVSIVITILSLVSGSSSSDSSCESYERLGFSSKKKCLSDKKSLFDRIPFWSKGKKKIKDVVENVGNKVTSVVADVVFNIMGINKLSMSLSPKKRLALSIINQEPGFDLTTEEMVKFKIWRKGIIPFFIDEYSFDKVLRDRIRTVLDEVNASTGVQFMEIPSPPTDENEKYVIFINRRGVLRCVDHTTDDFTDQGVQKVVLGYDCIDLKAGMASVILALLGVPPQHNAPNRDQHIEIIDQNILPDKASFFKALSNTDWLFHDVQYDFNSASHYPYHMYSAKGGSTIRPKWHITESGPVGEGKTLSLNDILKVKMLYNYISRSSNDDRKRTVCSDMFQPGNAFSKYHIHKDIYKPRIKPPQYLGTDPFAGMSQMENTATNDDGTNNDQETNGDQEPDNNEEASNDEDDTDFQTNKLKEIDDKVEKPNPMDQDEKSIDNNNAAIENPDIGENSQIYPTVINKRSRIRSGKFKGRDKLSKKSVQKKYHKNKF